ncbi:TPA: hypothetical protein QDC04_005558 [Burkholderia stabilis]|nr:cytochrome oxidase putative small subunit CydP [Burkholderia stabilis]HDR9494131.1 hypothetical protein [Burkholderia stabilis]HDR9524835.1 hypothetical protein [Burkholderia stabilis]HDR9534021.1 hypothetical protein [Burkholderia stabilis]HDR9536037.1 hypothetical protein [Burkholderia stabilis]HDR9545582.1 hypothetical protein [Burkholderia stabilis]
MALISINKEPAPPPPRPAGTIGWRARIVAWARGPTLARDITLVLIVKLILLMSLKYAFFNHPQAEHMSLPPAAVAERLLSVPAPASTEGDHHDK